MIKKMVGVVLFGSLLFAKVTNIPATTTFVEKKKMKIIDIRTKEEWIQMGIIKDAHLITFFDERYGYDTESFLKELDSVVEEAELFAIICNTGSRTKLISNFLGNKLDYNVVNLTGGMLKLLKEGFKPEVYNKSLQQEPIILKHPSEKMLKKEAEFQTPITETNSTK